MSDLAPVSKSVLQYLVETVVNQPQAVNIEVYESKDEEAVCMDVSVGDGDMGRVIGRGGRMANTIRSIVDAASIRDDCIVEVDFLDD